MAARAFTDEELVSALETGRTQEDAADALGVGSRCIRTHISRNPKLLEMAAGRIRHRVRCLTESLLRIQWQLDYIETKKQTEAIEDARDRYALRACSSNQRDDSAAEAAAKNRRG